jgi:cell division protein FtsI (penicillin-binding protein 3)
VAVKSRLLVVVAALAAWMALVGARLYELQVARHDEFTRRAERQQQRVIELDPPRGTIRDARGRELAVSVEVESAFAVPSEIRDPAAAARLLGAALKVDRAKLDRQLKSDREFVWVARKLDPPMARAARALALPGVYFLEESKRYYPLGQTAAHVLGYVGTDNQGLGGLEAMYDRVVAGKPGRRTVLRDAKAGMAVPPDLPSAAPVPGRDLALTLDAAIQGFAEEELAAAVERLRARSGSVVLLDPASGAVFAMASYPTFDPNRFAAAGEEAWRNRPVVDAYEPGSTFKMVTAAAALEQGLIDPDERLDCEMGSITLAGVRIADHKAFGTLSFREIVAKSSNVGTIKTALRVANRDFYETIRGFGFGRTTGIDLPGESPGLLMPVERWPALAKAYISFGQGISVTPLQLARAFGALANGGALLEPFVVAAVGAGEGTEPRHVEPVVQGRPVSERTLRTLVELLGGVTVEGGTGRAAAFAGYPVAGKTGTAQKAIPGRGYHPDEFVASFVGFAPVGRPALVGAVVLDDPRGTYHGGEAAAPVFGAIARKTLLYLNVRPERERPELWPFERDREAEARARAEKLAEAPAGEGSGEGAALPAPLAAVAAAAPPSGTVPDLAGRTAREVLAASSELRLAPVLRGIGRVTRQTPAPGAPLPAPGGRLEIWLGSGGAG